MLGIISRILATIASLFVARAPTVDDAVAGLKAVIDQADKAAKLHADEASAHAEAATASQASAVAATSDALRAARVSAKLTELLG